MSMRRGPGRAGAWRRPFGAYTAGGSLAAVGLAAWMAVGRPAAIDTPLRINGGQFEASGVAHVPGTNFVLVVDDGTTRELFLMELGADGVQKGSVVSVPFEADVTDLEGITSDGRHFYMVGSQSKHEGFEGDGLVRFVFDPTSRRVDAVERIPGLKAWLAANVSELHGTAQRTGDEVLNIEGLAWDPRHERLLLGLRAPIVDRQTLIVPIKLTSAEAAFTQENLRVDGEAIRLPLDGAGIRSLDYDEQTNAFLIIAAADLNPEIRDFRLLEWNGDPGAPPRHLVTFPRDLKPEGITRATLHGRSVTVLVFDTGLYAVFEPTR